MSDTPRSDEEEDVCRDCRVRFVSISFAQELERELTAARAELAAEREKVERLRDAHLDILNAHANDALRPRAFYISTAALSTTEPKP